MRLLADENFPKPVVDALRAEGHDVLWVRTDCPGWRDLAILELAEAEARIVLTVDRNLETPTGTLRAGIVTTAPMKCVPLSMASFAG